MSLNKRWDNEKSEKMKMIYENHKNFFNKDLINKSRYGYGLIKKFVKYIIKDGYINKDKQEILDSYKKFKMAWVYNLLVWVFTDFEDENFVYDDFYDDGKKNNVYKDLYDAIFAQRIDKERVAIIMNEIYGSLNINYLYDEKINLIIENINKNEFIVRTWYDNILEFCKNKKTLLASGYTLYEDFKITENQETENLYKIKQKNIRNINDLMWIRKLDISRNNIIIDKNDMNSLIQYMFIDSDIEKFRDSILIFNPYVDYESPFSVDSDNGALKFKKKYENMINKNPISGFKEDNVKAIQKMLYQCCYIFIALSSERRNGTEINIESLNEKLISTSSMKSINEIDKKKVEVHKNWIKFIIRKCNAYFKSTLMSSVILSESYFLNLMKENLIGYEKSNDFMIDVRYRDESEFYVGNSILNSVFKNRSFYITRNDINDKNSIYLIKKLIVSDMLIFYLTMNDKGNANKYKEMFEMGAGGNDFYENLFRHVDYVNPKNTIDEYAIRKILEIIINKMGGFYKQIKDQSMIDNIIKSLIYATDDNSIIKFMRNYINFVEYFQISTDHKDHIFYKENGSIFGDRIYETSMSLRYKIDIMQENSKNQNNDLIERMNNVRLDYEKKAKEIFDNAMKEKDIMINKLKEEHNKEVMKMQKTKDDLSKALEYGKKLYDEGMRLQEQLRSSNKTVEELKSEIIGYKTESQNSMKERESIEKSIEGLRKIALEYEKKLYDEGKNLQEQLKSSNKAVEELKNEVKVYKTESEKTLKEKEFIEKNVEELKKLFEVEGFESYGKHPFDYLINKIKFIGNEYKSFRNAIKASRGIDIDAFINQRSRLEAQLKGMVEYIGKLNSQNRRDLERQKIEYDAIIKEKDLQIQSLYENIDELKRENEYQKNVIEERNRVIDELQKSRSADRNEIEKLKRENKNYEMAMQNLRNENEKIKSEYETYKANNKVEDYLERLRQAEITQNRLNGVIVKYYKLNKKYKEDIDELKMAIEKREEAIEIFDDDLQKTTERYDKLKILYANERIKL